MLLRVLYYAVPYLTVGIGLLVFSNAWIAMLSYHAAMVLFLLSGRRSVFSTIFRGARPGIVLASAAVGACGGIVLYLLWPFLGVSAGISNHILALGITPESWPYFIGYYILINPVIEEAYWRGFLGSETLRSIPGDVFFAGYHLLVLGGQIGVSWLIAVFFVLSGAGWLWRQANRLSGGLLPSVLSHAAADITVILTIYHFT